MNKRKLACKDQIRKAWGIEVEDVLKDHLTTGARGLGRSTLEILATIAEESQLDQVESVLKDVVTERIDTDPHVGRSRKKKLTRQDVMDTRTRLKEQNSERRYAELGTEDLANIQRRRPRITLNQLEGLQLYPTDHLHRLFRMPPKVLTTQTREM